MEIKIFGKKLFEVSRNTKAEIFLQEASAKSKGSEFLPDFYSDRGSSFDTLSNWVAIEEGVAMNMDAIQKKGKAVKKKAPEKPKETVKLTPKGVYELKLLNDDKFVLNTNDKYVDEQLETFKEKLALIKSEEFDMRNGVNEISSIVIRLENRKKYAEVKDFFEQYPYTTGSKIADLLKAHDYLKVGQLAQFVADMPKEAVDAMKEYNKHTDKVCGKQAVFYIIADKKDFQKTQSRRDPILLAQSPFGHFWQIIGAWDKEMMFLEEL